MRNTSTNDPHETWANYVRALREATGLSRPQLAKRLVVDPATVWRWETGKQKPDGPAVPEALAEMFKLDLDEVLAAAGLRRDRPAAKPAPALPMDPDVQIIVRRLASPNVSEAEKTSIRATLRYLADLAERQEREGKGRSAS
ncbi:helix-turn-helix domain-containing protein [Micromonospora chersina]